MKAIICTAYGPPEVLQLTEVEKPVPRKNEVCIKVMATATTASDCIVRGFKIPRWHLMSIMMGLVLGFKKPRNPILGILLSGEIESIGSDVTLFKPGDEVFAWAVRSSTSIKFGSYAEYNCLPENGVIAIKPENLSHVETAAIPYGGLIAMDYLKKLGIKKGQKLLIYGASGSIGTSAVQIAKHAGAEVTGVCSTKNLEMVSSLGADRVIDYTRDTNSDSEVQYDSILDAVGKWKSSEFKKQLRNILAPGGRYISVDDGSPKATRENLLRLKELTEAGHLVPVIDRTWPLEEMEEAHRYVDRGHKRRNVIITVN